MTSGSRWFLLVAGVDHRDRHQSERTANTPITAAFTTAPTFPVEQPHRATVGLRDLVVRRVFLEPLQARVATAGSRL